MRITGKSWSTKRTEYGFSPETAGSGVEGADLAIASYTGEEMYVTGRIRSLAIDGAGREG